MIKWLKLWCFKHGRRKIDKREQGTEFIFTQMYYSDDVFMFIKPRVLILIYKFYNKRIVISETNHDRIRKYINQS